MNDKPKPDFIEKMKELERKVRQEKETGEYLIRVRVDSGGFHLNSIRLLQEVPVPV